VVSAGLHAAAGIECAFDGQAVPGELASVDLQQPGVIVAPLGVKRAGESDGLGCVVEQVRATSRPIDAYSERMASNTLMKGNGLDAFSVSGADFRTRTLHKSFYPDVAKE